MTKRRVFFSFHYERDAWRAGQVRNAGTVEGNEPLSDNDWEKVKGEGEKAIKRWIEEQISHRSCTVVLIGAKTAERPWVLYEIERTWKLGKGLVGIHVHGLKDREENQDTKGSSPFWQVRDDANDIGALANVVPVYDPSRWNSRDTYAEIKENIADWVEEGIAARDQYE